MKADKKMILICCLPVILFYLIPIAFMAFFYFFGSEEDSIYGYVRDEKYNYNFELYYFINYNKYYYMGIDDEKYLKDYDKVNEDNIETIKSLYNEFKNIMIEKEKSHILDFNENNIDYDDYYIIYNYCDSNKMDSCTEYREFALQLYDAQTNILYVFEIYKRFYR